MKLSRRLLTPLLFGLLGAALMAAGLACGAAEEKAPVAPTSTPSTGGVFVTPVIAAQTTPTAAAPAGATPTYGGTFRTSSGYESRSLSWGDRMGYGLWTRVGGTFNTLLRYDLHVPGLVVPDLAESWDVVSASEYIFHIRKGVKFQCTFKENAENRHGACTDLTAKDVVYSYEKHMDPQWSTRGIVSGTLESVELIDDYTVRMKTKGPDAGFLAKTAVGWHFIAPEGTEREDENLVGTGAFVFEQWERGIRTVHTKNADYWRTDRPYIDEMLNLTIEDSAAHLAAFRSKQLDMNAPMGFIYAAEARVLNEQHPEVTVSVLPRLWWQSVVGKMTDPVWSDLRIRQAFNLAVDRAETLATLSEGYGDIGNVQPPWTKYSLTDKEMAELVTGGLAHDWGENMPARLQKAKDLLTEAGYPNGIDLTLLVYSHDEALTPAEWVVGQLSRAGIRVTLDVQETGVMTDMADRGQYQLVWAGGVAPFVDPSLFYTNYYLCDSVTNRAEYCSPEFDALFTKQMGEVDEAKRLAIVHDMERMFLKDMPAMTLRWVAEGGAWWPWVKNYDDVDPAYYNNITWEDLWLDLPRSKYD